MSLYDGGWSEFHTLRRSTHLLPDHLISMVTHQDFEDAMRNAENDEDTKAFLMIQALDGISLDTCGKSPADFYIQGNETILFNIHFERTCNFIGMIVLPVGSGRANQLIGAIEKNLGSKMYKAAVLGRKLDRWNVRMLERADKKARAAFREIYNREYSRYSPEELIDNTGLRISITELADEAFDRVYDPRKEQLFARSKSVLEESYPVFRGSYLETVANFLYHHLPFLTAKR